MAQNVKIAGASYSDVPAVELPKADNSGNARFTDTSDATATADKILQGYSAYGASGTKLNGTAQSGGGGTDHDFLVTADFDLDTLALSNVSATLAEVVAAAEADKDVRLLAHADIDGVATIVFAAPLVFSENISVYNFQTALFQTRLEIGSGPAQVNIHASSGDHNGEFVVIVVEDPEPARGIVSFSWLQGSGYSVDNVTWEEGNSESAFELLTGDYPERLQMYLITGTALHLSNVDRYNNIAVFTGSLDGIKYTLELAMVLDAQDIPSGAYYDTVYDDNGDPSYYVVYDLDADLDGVSYIYVDVNTTEPQSGGPYFQTEVTNVTLPDKFLEKMTIMGLKRQLKNVSVIEHLNGSLSLLDNIVLDVFMFNIEANITTFTSNAVSTNLVPSFTSIVYFGIVPTQPYDGYYIEIPGMGYLKVSAETGMGLA